MTFPVLKGSPMLFTKSSSNEPATFTIPGMITAWMVPRMMAETTKVISTPFTVGV